LRKLSSILGLLAVLAFLSLSEQVVFRAELGKSFLFFSWRESVWLVAHAGLLLPGLLLLAWGQAPLLGRGWDWLAARRPRDKAAPLLYALLLFVLAWLGRALFLLDLPVTHDEHTMRFGAQVLLDGSYLAPDIDPQLGLVLPHVYRRAGGITSMDFPGTQHLKALAMASGLDFLVFAALAALSGALLVGSLRHWLEGPWRGLVAWLWLLSPMVFCLSLTEHSHLVSRSAVAVAWALYLVPTASGARWSRGRAAAFGLAVAFGFLARPPEAAAAVAPLLLDLAWRARCDATARATALWAWGVSALGPLYLAFYQAAVTGAFWVSPRVLDNRTMAEAWWPAIWLRLGNNVGFNAVMLSIWFVGPALLLLLVLVAARDAAAPGGADPGSERHRRLARLAACSVAAGLALALGHSDTGIRVVGPIHHSEAAVPLLVLASLGLDAAAKRWPAWPRSVDVRAQIVGYLASLVAFTAINTGTLVDQAIVQRSPLLAVAHLRQAVVVSDRPYQLWFKNPAIREISSWVSDLPHPDPLLQDEVLFAYADQADLAKLRAAFPQRKLYRMTFHEGPDPIRVAPIP
jgi:hypothetical protein